MSERKQTQLAASLSDFLWKSLKGRIDQPPIQEDQSQLEDDDSDEIEIDYVKLAELN